MTDTVLIAPFPDIGAWEVFWKDSGRIACGRLMTRESARIVANRYRKEWRCAEFGIRRLAAQ